MQQGQGTAGALIVRWQQAPGQNQTSPVLERNLNFFQQLQQNGVISNITLFADVEGVDYEAVLVGDVDQLIDLVKQTDYRTFLSVSRASLPRFRVITAIAGSNGDAQEVLREIERSQRVAQQLEQQRQGQMMLDQQNEGQQGQQSQRSQYATVGSHQGQSSGQARY